jgi:hypothetical protein
MRIHGSDASSDTSALCRFLELLRTLMAELREHNRAISEVDVLEVEQRLVAEHNICAELGCLFPQITNAMQSIHRELFQAKADSETEGQLYSLCEHIRIAASELSDVLRTHVALTLRSRKSMRALANVLCMYSGQPLEGSAGVVKLGGSYGT